MTFRVTIADPPLLVPATAVIFRAGPPAIAVVREDGVVHLQPVQLGRDLGSSVEVISGLAATDRFIPVPGGNLQEGARMHAVLTPPPERPASG